MSLTLSYENGLFGLASQAETARVLIIPVPWEVTTSYGGGTANGPEAVLKASPQLDLFDLELGDAYKKGFHLCPISPVLQGENDRLRPLALEVREGLESGEILADYEVELKEINRACLEMSEWVYTHAKRALERGQIPAVLGGDHSSPEGNIRAISESCDGKFGILHLDAHADLRESYQGFERSHASIMYNVMHSKWQPEKLVQVGIRDFCAEEFEVINKSVRIETFFDVNLKRAGFQGESWHAICERILEPLPQNVYVSFDIDGLSPEFCPGTGTPVPGGLSFDQATYLLRVLVESGRKILGFDLNEVAPSEDSEWDGNVGARLLYKLCGWSVISQDQPRVKS